MFYPRLGNLMPRSVMLGIFLSLTAGSILQAQTAQSVNLAWNASPDASVTGYRVHYGTASGTYISTVDVAKSTTAAISNLTAGTGYFFAATAYNASGVESIPSNEASTIAQPLQTGIASVARLSNGSIQVTVIGKAGLADSIYVSSDLKTWTLLSTVTNTTGTLLVTDSGAASLTRRFYRMTDTTGTTAPAGFLTLTVTGATSTLPQPVTYLGMGLTNPVSYSGTVSAFATQTVTDAQSHWNANQFSGPTGEFYIEIVSGSYAGVTSDILATDGAAQSLKIADDLSPMLKGGEQYRIRRHRTIGDVFGRNNEAKLNGATSVATADEVRIFNPLTQSFLSYYYQTGGVGGIGWRSSTDATTDASGTTLYLDQGIAVCRKVAGSLNLLLAGSAKTGPAVVPVEPNLNFLANMYPAGTRTLGNSGLYVGNETLGLAGGSGVTNADEVRIYNGTKFLSYYYKTSGSGGTGWRNATSSSTSANSKQIPVGTSVYVVRKSGRPAFNWFITQPF